MLLNNLPITDIYLPLTASGLSKKGFVLMAKEHAPVPYTVGKLLLHWPRKYVPLTKPNPDNDPDDPLSPTEVPTNQLDYLEENCFCILVWITEVHVINGQYLKVTIQEHKGVLERKIFTSNYNIVDPLVMYADVPSTDPYKGLYRLFNPIKDYRTESGIPDFLDILDEIAEDFTEAETEYVVSYNEFDTNYHVTRPPTNLNNSISFEIYDYELEPKNEIESWEHEKPPYIPIDLYWSGMSAGDALEDLTKYYACRILASDITDINKTESVYQWRRRRKFDDRFFNRRIGDGYYPINIKDEDVITPKTIVRPVSYILSPIGDWDISGEENDYANNVIGTYGSIIFPYFYYTESKADLLLVYEEIINYIISTNVNTSVEYVIDVTPHDYSWYYGPDWDEAEIIINGTSDSTKLKHFKRPITKPEFDPSFDRRVPFVATLTSGTTRYNNVTNLEDGFIYPQDMIFTFNQSTGEQEGNKYLGLLYDDEKVIYRNAVSAFGSDLIYNGEKISNVVTRYFKRTTPLPTLLAEIAHQPSGSPLVWKLITPDALSVWNDSTGVGFDISYDPNRPRVTNRVHSTVVYQLDCNEEELNEYLWDLVVGPDPDDDTYVSPLVNLVPLDKFLFDKYVHTYYEEYKLITVPIVSMESAAGLLPSISGVLDPDLLKLTERTLPISPVSIYTTLRAGQYISSSNGILFNNIPLEQLPKKPTNPSFVIPDTLYSNVNNNSLNYVYDTKYTFRTTTQTFIPSLTEVLPFDLHARFRDYIYMVWFGGIQGYVGYIGSRFYPS